MSNILNIKSGKSIQSVQRAIDILNCFDEIRVELSLGQISTMLDLNKSTVHGILNTLHNNGYVRQNCDGKYLLGANLLSKNRYAASSDKAILLTTSKPHMLTISKRYRVTTNLFIIDEINKPMFIYQEYPANAVYAISHVSDDMPLYCTASGKLSLSVLSEQAINNYIENTNFTANSEYTITDKSIFLYELENIREKGYSYEKDELGEGVSAISMPICNATSQLIGAISVTSVTFYMEKNKLQIINDLKKAAVEISRDAFGAVLNIK